MKSFSKLYSDFWINHDNSEVIKLGLDAQLMALYLQGNSHHNMLGVYYLPLLYTASDLKLSVKKAHAALKKLCDISYCKYDEKTQYVWVCNMALEQIGEDIDIKDNRIKAIQTIWNTLPTKLVFLAEVYHKYQNTFHLAFRFPSSFDSLNSKIDNITSATNLEEIVETNQNIEIDAGTNNFNLTNIDLNRSISEEPAIDASLNPIPPSSTIEASSMFTSIFEGVSKPLQSPPMVESVYNFCKTNISIAPLKVINTASEDCMDAITYSDAPTSTQNLSDVTIDKNEDTTLPPLNNLRTSFISHSKDLTSHIEDPLNGLTTPFEAPSKGLQSPSEAHLEPLRSNIEYRSKNTENRNKKEEVEEDLKKKEKKKNIKLNNVPIPNIVVQARPFVEKSPEFNSSFLKPSKKTRWLETTEAIEITETRKANKTMDTEHQPVVYESHNFPMITTEVSLESNAAAKNTNTEIQVADSAISVIPATSAVFIAPAIPVFPVDTASADVIAVIFKYWKIVMQHPRANLDCKRSSLIRKALRMGYTVQQLCDAIVGCSITPHNMGENKQGQRYDGLHIILRDADQIDRFIRNYHRPPKPRSVAQERLLGNVCGVNEWLKNKNKFSKFTEKTENSFFRSNYA